MGRFPTRGLSKRYDSTRPARSVMSTVSKVVFLADKLEPDKVRRRPELGEVLRLASVDIDTALLEYVNRQIVRGVERGDLLHPYTLEFRNGAYCRLSKE